MIKIWWFIKVIAGFGSVADGSICWYDSVFSGIPWAHDYTVRKGGDGHPCHFHTYTCHKCGKKFGI